MLNVIVQVTGTLFGVHAALKMRVVGGPLTIQLSSDPIKLSDIWKLIDQQLETFGLSLPDMSGTPWGAIISDVSITPSLWIAPSGSDPSREAAYLELAFSEAIHIGGSRSYGPVTITLEPDISIEALFIGYDPGESGISLRAKISTPTSKDASALPALAAIGSPGGDKSQIVSYPFPLPAQNSVSAFELKYFGLGQRVGPTAVVKGDDPLAAIFDQLENQLVGTDPADIITRVAKNFYHPDRNWFIAADLIFRGWELRILFNDPAFYGFSLTVPPKPPSLFAGLMIEILYQKLGPNLGVYYGALTLPEMMRRIPMEGFILVLPGFSVWIYTNGDFRVNVGWPIGPNSIGILMDVLTGEAGFYFARLRSSDDPGAQSNVDYNPILAFGIGITVYASEGISSGPFTASLSVTVSVTLQGLLAWYAQGDGGTTNILTNQPDHYWFAGTAGIWILLQGSIDFAIIKASVEVSASIYADIAFETGYGTVVNATASVSVRVSVKIVFFTIHLSFSVTISHQFVVTGPTDKLASIKGPQGAGLAIVGGDEAVALHAEARFAARSMLARFAANQPVPMLRHTAWAALGAGAGAPTVNLYFVLQPTAVYDSSPSAIELIASLVAECPPPDSSPLPSPGAATGFASLVTGLVYWLLDDYSHQGDSWSDRFQQILDALGPSGEPPGPLFGGSYEGFAAALEQQFFAHYVRFRLLGASSASPPAFDTAALLPMFPQLRLIAAAAGGTITIDFANYNRTPANYQIAIDMYFEALGQIGPPPSDGTVAAVAAGAPPTGPSIASYLFGDYFVMLARYVIQQLRAAAKDSQAQHEAAFFARVEAAGAAPFEITDAVAAHVQAISGTETLNDQLDSFNYASAAGIGSRFMLHGLQLPIPADVPSTPTPQNMPAVPTDGIYALSGQQFPVAAGAASGTATLELSPASPTPNWIAFGPSGTDSSVSASTTLPTAVPAAPAIIWRGISSPGSGLPNEIDIRSMPPVVSQQLSFALKNRVTWEASSSLSPGEQRVILPLPQPLQAEAARLGGVDLQLSMQTPANGGLARMAQAPMNGAPALLIRLSLSQVQQPANVDITGSGSPSVASSPGGQSAPQYVPFVYQLGGTDEATRELIYQALQDPSRLKGATVSLLYTPPGSGIAQSDVLVPDALLAKTNLSTLNQAPQVSFAHGQMMASLGAQFDLDWALVNGQVAEFLRLVWEVSVVQAPGFYLYYQTVDGKGLPSDLFADTAAGATSPHLAATSPELSGTVPTTGSQSAQFDILVRFAAPQQNVELPSYGNAIWVNRPDSANPIYALVSDSNRHPVPQYTSGYPAGSIGFEIDWTPLIESPPPLVPVNELYHLIQYRVAPAGAYMQSVWSLPVGPTADGHATPSPPGAWRFQHTLPVVNFLGAGSPANRYEIIGRPAKLEFTVVDIYGNPLPGRYDAGFTPLYQDPLISIGSWPGVQIAYGFAPGGAGTADLVLKLTFDAESLAPLPTGSHAGSPHGSPGSATNNWHRQLRAVDARYALILDQLNDPNTSVSVTASLMPAGSPLGDPVSALTAFVASIRAEIAVLLEQVAPSPATIISPPITSRIVLPVPYASVIGLPADILPLTVTVTMERKPALVDPLAQQNMPAATAVSFAVSPDMSNPPGSPNEQNSPIRRFAQDFEAAFAGFDGHAGKLLLTQRPTAAGLDRHASNLLRKQRAAGNTAPEAGQIPDLWVVRWSPTAGIDVVFEKPSPTRDELLVYWALKPLNTSPMSGTVDGKTYSKIDLDVWAQQFLAAVDAFLAPQLAVAVALLDERHGTQYYQQLLSYKQQLAQAIPRSLANVLADQAGMGDAEQARERLSQALLSRLSNAYTVSTVVQAAAQVSIVGRADISSSPGAPAPQLYGSVGPSGGSVASPPFSPGGASASRPYTFSPGELKLSGAGTPPNQWMTVLLTVADPSNQSEIAVPLTYQVNFLQHDFMTGEAYEGYVPSSWLKFILPSQPALTLPVTGPGSPAPVAQIPIPLPFVPDAPVLSDPIAKQSPAVASPASPSSIEQEIENAMRWDYQATVQRNWAAQDALDFIITYNAAVSTARVGAGLGGSPSPLAVTLFNALAPFVASYPQLSAQFGAIVQEAYPAKGSPGPGSPGASAIIQQFTQLVGAVAEAWSSQPLALEMAAGGTTRIDEFVLMPIPSSPGALSVRLRGRAVQPQSPSLPDYWPSLSPHGAVTLTPWMPDPSQAQYRDGWWELEHTWAGLGPGEHIGALDALKLSWNALKVLDRQTAELSAYVVRNAELIQGEATNPDFIYQTQTVRFANPAIPLIVAQPLPPLQPLDTLTQTLERIFAPMMGAGQTLNAFIRLEANYSYELVPGPEGDAVVASSAILLADDVMLDGGGVSPGTIAAPIAAEIGNWHSTHRLPSAGSRLNLAITLFATVELQQFPLVQFEDIPIRVDGVLPSSPSWWH